MALIWLNRLIILITVYGLILTSLEVNMRDTRGLGSTFVLKTYEHGKFITTTEDVFNGGENVFKRQEVSTSNAATKTPTTTSPSITTSSPTPATVTTTSETTLPSPTTNPTTTTTAPTKTSTSATTTSPTTTSVTMTTTLTTTGTTTTTTTPTPTTTTTTATLTITTQAPSTTTKTTDTSTETQTTEATSAINASSTPLPPRTKYPVLQQLHVQGGCPLGYELDEVHMHGNVCVHNCENVVCENLGHCVVQIGDNMKSSAGCSCTSDSETVYSGPTCAERHMTPARERAIILGVLIPIAGLLLLIAVCACYSLQKYRHAEFSFRNKHDINNL